MRIPVFALATLVLVLDPLTPAFAGRFDMPARWLDTDANNAESLVRVQGELGCDSGHAPAGAPCALILEESPSGKRYHLETASAADAMKLYQAGTRHVAIEGSLIDRDTIRISQATGL